jgi:hypothetical protein
MVLLETALESLDEFGKSLYKPSEWGFSPRFSSASQKNSDVGAVITLLQNSFIITAYSVKLSHAHDRRRITAHTDIP